MSKSLTDVSNKIHFLLVFSDNNRVQTKILSILSKALLKLHYGTFFLLSVPGWSFAGYGLQTNF